MKERELKARLEKIKNSISQVNKVRNEVNQTRDNLFAEILSELDQEHDHLVALVRTAQYELLFDELLEEQSQGEDTVE